MPLTGFELRISGIGSDHSTNSCPKLMKFRSLLWCCWHFFNQNDPKGQLVLYWVTAGPLLFTPSSNQLK